jgi:hypothetical protein
MTGIYVLQAKLGPQITTQAIQARDLFSAKVLAAHKIYANYISDKRYSKGEITLKNPQGRVVWTIPALEEEKKEVKKNG